MLLPTAKRCRCEQPAYDVVIYKTCVGEPLGARALTPGTGDDFAGNAEGKFPAFLAVQRADDWQNVTVDMIR